MRKTARVAADQHATVGSPAGTGHLCCDSHALPLRLRWDTGPVHEAPALTRRLRSLQTLGLVAVVACGGRTSGAVSGSSSGAVVSSGATTTGLTSDSSAGVIGGSGTSNGTGASGAGAGSGSVTGNITGSTSGGTTTSGAASGNASGSGTGAASGADSRSCPGPTRFVDVDGSTGLINTGKCVCAENAYSLDGGACTCQVDTPNLCTYDAGQAAQCVDESIDPNNCGGCGVTCKISAACVGSMCGQEPTQLVRPAPGCVSMRVVYDSGNIYWSDMGHGTISSIPVGGGPVTTIASGQGIAAVQNGVQGILMWPGPLATGLLVHAGTVYWVGASSPVQCPADAGGSCFGGDGTTLMSATAGSAPKTLLTMAMDPVPSPVSATDSGFSIETLGQNPPINAIALSPDGSTLYFAAGTRFYSVPTGHGGPVTYVGYTEGPEHGEATALVANDNYLCYPANFSGTVEILSLAQMCDLDAALNYECPYRAQFTAGQLVPDTIEVQGNMLYWGIESDVRAGSVAADVADSIGSRGYDFPSALNGTNLTGFAVGAQNAYFGETGTELVCSEDYTTACVQAATTPFPYVCPESIPANQTCVTLGYVEKGAAPPFDSGMAPRAVVIARAQPTPMAFALDGTNVYWTTSRCDISYLADSPQ
jgi:hypothetical protein